MSTRFNNGSNYENHQRAAELHNAAAHAHRVAEQSGTGKQDVLSNHDHSRMAFAHSQEAHRLSQQAAAEHMHGGLEHVEIAALAHKLWLQKGSPEGSPDEDWFQATALLTKRPVQANTA